MGAVNQIESSMQSRLHIMIELCDAAVFLPGGFGTLEEASSLLVRNDLSNICRDNIRPLIFVNHHGFFDPLLGMFDRFIAEGFVPPERKRFIHSVDSPEALIDKVRELNSVAPLTSRDMTMKHAEATGMFNINQPR